MPDQRRNGRNNRGAGRGRDDVPEDINEGISIKHVLIILIIAIGAIAFWRTSGHVFTSTPSSVPELVPNAGRHRHEAGRGRAEPLLRSYQVEAEIMQKIITKYASMQRAGENNETVENAGKPQGKTGTFVLNSGDDDESNGDGAKEEEEQQYEDLDPVDLAFIDAMIEDIQETEESEDRAILELQVNELEEKLGRKLTKYRMTPEELDADTTLDEDARQTFEFRNVRQGFVDIWVKRLRELKSENYEKYYKLPHEHTMVEKILLKNNFDAYVAQFWDIDAKRQKRDKNKTPTPKSPPVTDSVQLINIDKDKEIKDILEAVHYTEKYQLIQDMEEELEELKRIQGQPPPKVDMKEHIRNNFIYSQRERRASEGFKKKSVSEYTDLEIEEFKAAWQEYFEFYKEKYEETDGGADAELTLDELEHLDNLIDAIEKTPRYFEIERHRKRLEELDEMDRRDGHKKSKIFGRQPGDPERTEFDKDMTRSIVGVMKEVQRLEREFIKVERARLKQSKSQDSGRDKKSTEDDDDSEDDEDEDFFLRDYREPEEYSLAEKVQLNKRYELFERDFMSKIGSKITVPRPERDDEEISEALINNKLDYLDELIEDIYQTRTPTYEARLDVEALTAKFVKTAPDNRDAVLQLQYFQMRRKFINEERVRLVGKLTESKIPNDYTFDAKEELRCRWVDFYERNWSPEKQKEMRQFQKARDERNKKQEKKRGKKKEAAEEEDVNPMNEYETSLMNHLIDEIYDQNEFTRRKKFMKEYDEEVEANWKLKEQLIRQKEGASLTPVDKIIHEFAQNSLTEFLKMRGEFILSEKKIAQEKSEDARSKGLTQFSLMPSDMTDIMKRWKVKFRTYKTKVDKLFQTLGN